MENGSQLEQFMQKQNSDSFSLKLTLMILLRFVHLFLERKMGQFVIPVADSKLL